MNTEPAPNKIDAIYELREAVETKTRAEVALESNDTAVGRDALLAAQLDLEAKTQEAIEACHECGEVHADDAVTHAKPATRLGNVIAVDFRPLESRL